MLPTLPSGVRLLVVRFGLPPLVSGFCGGGWPLLLKNAANPDHVLRAHDWHILLTVQAGESHSFSIACLAAFTAAVRVFHSLKAVVGNREITRLTVGHFPSLWSWRTALRTS